MVIHQITKEEAFNNPFAKDIYLIKVDLDKKVMYYFPIKTLSGEIIVKESIQPNTIFCRIDWKGDNYEEKTNPLATKPDLGPWECPGQLSLNKNGEVDIPGSI